jgi:hypothetical protein
MSSQPCVGPRRAAGGASFHGHLNHEKLPMSSVGSKPQHDEGMGVADPILRAGEIPEFGLYTD